MLWRTHALAGINSLWLLVPLPHAVTPDTVGPMAAFAAVGALLPDLDSTRSKIRSVEIKGVRPLVPLSLLVSRAFGHRGLLHSLPGWLGFGFLCLPLASWTGWQAALALWLGYGSHLAADACTRSGIPAWPNRRNRRLHLLPSGLRFVTGSPAEDALLPLLAVCALWLLLRFLLPSGPSA